MRLAAGLLVGMVALGACGGERANNAASNGSGGRLSIATGNTTGVFYVLGGGYAQLINQNLSGYRATAEATGGSVENINRVVSGQSDIALTQADTAYDAISGSGSFTSKQPIVALARIYTNHTQVVVRTASGINSIEDMKGKKISTGSAKSGTEVMAMRLMQSAGLDPDKDVTRQKLSLPEAVEGMKHGGIDGLIYLAGTPAAGLKDLVSAMKGKVKFLDLDKYLPAMQKISPLYQAETISKDVYGMPNDTKGIGVPNLVIVRNTMSPDLEQKLTALLFDHQADLIKVHPEAKNYNLQLAQETGQIQLAEGAKRYYAQHKNG
jgi:TRAP transporter TAXI family solute receptor